MKLKVVTFTGADDTVNHQDLIEVTKKFPDISIEWGILFSPKRVGTERYPSKEWISQLPGNGLNLVAHLCGDYVHELGRLRGTSESHVPQWIQDFPDQHEYFRGVQINSGHQPPNGFLETEYIRSMKYLRDKAIIVQSDGNKLAHYFLLETSGFDVLPLVDSSGGNGKEAVFTEPSYLDCKWGFAGGINPDNVVEKVLNIMEVYRGNFWIDMETGVRSVSSMEKSVFDMKKVESVLTQIQELRNDLKEIS